MSKAPIAQRRGAVIARGEARARSKGGLPFQRALSWFAGWLCVASASGQLITDQIPRERIVPTAEQVRQDVASSRLRLGPIRLIPQFSISGAGYDANVLGTPDDAEEEPIADWSATVSAGVRALLPVGRKVYIRGDVTPEYSWFRELESRRSFGGVYGATLLGLFNRMSMEVGGSTNRGFALLNSETEARVIQNLDDARANLEIDATRAVSFYAGARAQRLRYSLRGPELPSAVDPATLNRTDAAVLGGVRFRVSPQWTLSAGVEGMRTAFAESNERDNEGFAFLAGLHYSRPRFYFSFSGGYREGRPWGGSRLPDYSTATGSYFASYFVHPRVEIRLSGDRRVAYSVDDLEGNPYYIQTRNGGGLNIQVLSRLLLRGYADYGINDYPFRVLVGDSLVDREDEVSVYGGGISILFFRKAVFTAVGERLEHSSNLPGQDRTVTRFRTGLSFSGELSR